MNSNDTPTGPPEVPRSSDLLDMLRRHYMPDGRPPGGIFAPEIGSPDGLRRADLIWAPYSIATGQGLVGHEIKVSRADVVVELADPMKAEPWARYCNFWWLVVTSPDLVAGLTIPDRWGVMTPPSGRRTRTMTVLRPAPRLRPNEQAPGIGRVSAWMDIRRHSTEAGLRSQIETLQADVQRERERVAAARSASMAQRDPRLGKIMEIIEGLDRSPGGDYEWLPTAETDEIVAAIKDTLRVREANRTAKRALESLAHALDDPLKRALEAVQRVAVDI